MKLIPVKPRKALNKAFLKVKPLRPEIDKFKANLIKLVDTINENESEEFHKNLVSSFLKDTYYKENYFINTKGRTDLVIHNGKDAKNTVGVIIEAKKPTNKAEMLKKDNINTKAFQELVLYYLRERISLKNLEIKYLIATNIYEWFIFDANTFEKEFAQNNKLVKKFTDFEEGRLAGKTTDFFYKEIAEPTINNIQYEIEFTYFDIREYEKPLKNNNKQDDNLLIALFKLLSPEHLLKLPFKNDSNSLDKAFYSELLHLIGLSETKDGSKKVIGRKPEKERNQGSIIENAITILQYEDCLGQIKATNYGATKNEQLYNIALELTITWINRILFLKLLEGQLIKYHNGDNSYKFLTIEQIPGYDALNKLFFQVLAIKENERTELVKKKFGKIPYLNSSLFEPNELEHKTIRISNLEDEYKLPILNSTVLKNKTGKRINGEKNTLEYVFEFLDAYDFASEGSEDIQEENKTLINASVLGLIFEKINGYKDGSFFTPGFITMYMAKETIRRAVVQKFNEAKGWECKVFNDIYNKINNKQEANQIINSLKICDPAVGSGHFLVSALNEIIAVKSELGILMDIQGKTLRDYTIEVVNDELIITDEDGHFFEYNPKNKESQRVQETLFHEKQTIIENCLFGVDINPNSVKICRLRLWIELLKNAYYKQEGSEGLVQKSEGLTQSQTLTNARLETLPNIDINIKCGNSLISRYALDADIKQALKKSKWTIDSYRIAVMTYRNAKNKEEKQQMEKLINEIKNDFESEIAANDKRLLKLNKLKGDLFALTNQQQLFEQSKAEKAKWEKNVNKTTADIQKFEKELEEIKSNKIYENAFEWRFEFPEVLNDEGDFIGFDVVIGNPPYINFANLSSSEREFYKNYKLYKNKTDLYAFFVKCAEKIKNINGFVCLIIPHTWISTISFYPLRELLLNNLYLTNIVELDFGVFKDAYVKTVIIQTGIKSNNKVQILNDDFNIKMEIPYEIIQNDKELKINLTWNPIKYNIYLKIKNGATPLGNIVHFSRGIKTSNDKRFLFYENKGSDYYKVIRGRNIKAFRIDYSNEYIWYRPDLMKEKVGCLPHSKELFLTDEKIITQRVNSSGQLLATYDDEKFFCLDTTNISTERIDNKCNLKFLVGILNSQLINWWFNDEFKNPTISGYELHQIPIKRNFQIETKISKLVESIINNNKKKINFDKTNEMIKIIDQLVYQLYGLTEEEIRIVEESIK